MHGETIRADRCAERDAIRSRLLELYEELKPAEHEAKIAAQLGLAILNLGDSVDAGNDAAR